MLVKDKQVKKIGIMSMQRIANYGSFLQSYALKQLLEELGCKVEFVDYHIDEPVVKENLYSKNRLVNKFKKGLEILFYKVPFSHKIAFVKYKWLFEKRYMPLLGVSNIKNYNPELDCLIIGSDEVFNCIQKNLNVGYSLELFGKNNRANKLITFAASFGNTTLEKLNKFGKTIEISNLLKKFDAISVRDENSEKIVERLVGKKPVFNLDPVLIYDYVHCCDKIQKIKRTERYLLLYAYSGRISEAEAKWISTYAKQKGLKIYTLGGIQKYADSFIDCSPFDVLAYFNNAEEIITDTFHGSIFSVITHRPFATLMRKSVGGNYGNEEKVVDLLRRLRLTSRMTTDIVSVAKINTQVIDYNEIDNILQWHRNTAYTYLRENIGI